MSDVFLDTVGPIAVWDSSDQWHAAATAAYRDMLARGQRLATTDYVLLECGNAAARRPYRARVSVLRQLLANEKLLIAATPEEFEDAWAAYDRGEAG
jgi:predicted nucleic acid-binding protein